MLDSKPGSERPGVIDPEQTVPKSRDRGPEEGPAHRVREIATSGPQTVGSEGPLTVWIIRIELRLLDPFARQTLIDTV